MGVLIPPACREEVLGDLYERYDSPSQYILEALRVLPMVVASRIWRTVDLQVLLMQGLVLYLSYMGAAWYLERTLLAGGGGFAKLAAPGVMFLAGLMLDDAYAMPDKRSTWKTARGLITGLGVAYGVELALTGFGVGLGARTMLIGSLVSFLLTSAIRILFPPVTERPIGASGPAYWLQHQADGEGFISAGVLVGVSFVVLWMVGPSMGHLLLVGLVFLIFGLNRTS